MKKNQIDELTKKLNEFRMNNSGKTFTGAELNEALIKLGFKSVDASAIAQKSFPFEQMGKNRLYEVPREPIHKSVLIGINNRQNKYFNKEQKEKTPVTFAEAKEVNDAIHLLLSKGYKISRPLGLDVKQLLTDHPELAQKYMRYANV